ncbi:hypothetical protein Tco_0006288 [Tanacetum coccineum]
MLSLSCAATKLAAVVIALSTLSPPPNGQPHLLHGLKAHWLVPSCFVIFDLEPLSLSLTHLFRPRYSKIFYPSVLIVLCHLEILVVLTNMAHTLHHLEVLRFPAQSVGSSNTDVLDLPCLLVLIAGTSQSRQHESRKLPTAVLFDDDTGRISIRHCEY